MIIDAHLHVWDRSRARYDWLGPHLPEVDRDIRFAEITPTLKSLGVSGVVLVQSADNADDTDNMLAVAENEPLIRGVVGWVPLEDPRAASVQLPGRAADARIVGVRNLIHDRSDPDWVLRPGFRSGLGLLAAYDLPFDFVTADAAALSRLARLAELHPGQLFILDHLGKPPLNGTEEANAAWSSAIRGVAEFPNVVAKVSGLYSSVGPQDSWTRDGLQRVIDVAVEAFGPERLMYGGDWPMSLRAGGYERVFAGLHRAVEDWPDAAAQHFWGRTAVRAYGLDVGATDAEDREAS